jgi:uncharacterized protein (DUF58 family)
MPSNKSHPSWLSFRHRAEAAAAGLPDLIAAAEKAASSVLAGEHRQQRTGPGERFWQFRDYDPSDRPQDIDWRQSAKGDRVFIRQRERQNTQTVLLWLQGNKGMEYRSAPALPTKREDAAVLALGTALLLTRRGELTGLLDGANRPGRSGAAIQTLAEDLLHVPSAALPQPRGRSVPANAGVMLFGDFLTDPESTLAAIEPLAGRAPSGMIVQVLDPAELTLPFSGRVVFEEMDGRADHHVMNVESVREAYRQRIEDHCENLRQLCCRYRWHYMRHITGDEITPSLFHIWRAMSGELSGVRPA